MNFNNQLSFKKIFTLLISFLIMSYAEAGPIIIAISGNGSSENEPKKETDQEIFDLTDPTLNDEKKEKGLNALLKDTYGMSEGLEDFRKIVKSADIKTNKFVIQELDSIIDYADSVKDPADKKLQNFLRQHIFNGIRKILVYKLDDMNVKRLYLTTKSDNLITSVVTKANDAVENVAEKLTDSLTGSSSVKSHNPVYNKQTDQSMEEYLSLVKNNITHSTDKEVVEILTALQEAPNQTTDTEQRTVLRFVVKGIFSEVKDVMSQAYLEFISHALQTAIEHKYGELKGTKAEGEKQDIHPMHKIIFEHLNKGINTTDDIENFLKAMRKEAIKELADIKDRQIATGKIQKSQLLVKLNAVTKNVVTAVDKVFNKQKEDTNGPGSKSAGSKSCKKLWE